MIQASVLPRRELAIERGSGVGEEKLNGGRSGAG